MKRILIYEPQGVIRLDLNYVLKDHNVVFESKSPHKIPKVLSEKEFDLLIFHFSYDDGSAAVLESIIYDYQLPVIGLTDQPRRILNIPDNRKCKLLQLPYDPAELLGYCNTSQFSTT
jgi:DNA-binding NarL/FixJ family response regulator